MISTPRAFAYCFTFFHCSKKTYWMNSMKRIVSACSSIAAATAAGRCSFKSSSAQSYHSAPMFASFKMMYSA